MRTMSILLLFLLILQGSVFSMAERWRAFWVVRDALVSEESIRTMVDRVADSGCNMIFVQVCGRGDSYYNSDLLPRAEALSDSGSMFDPLEITLRLAHARDLEVHAWVNTFYIWSAVEEPLNTRHVVHTHPEWIEYTVEEQSLSEYDRPRPFHTEGIYLSPGLPEVRTWITNVAGEIADRYDVDGIHLDYVRYPGDKTGFHPEAVLRFEDQYRFDPVLLYRDNRGQKMNEDHIDSLRTLWVEWRCQQVTETVRMIGKRIKARKPAVKLSAAVKPDYDQAREKFSQDWGTWMERELLDFVVTMTYSSSTDRVLEQIRSVRRKLGGRSFFAGIGIYNQPILTTIEQIRGIRSIGVDGLSLFSYNTVSQDDEYLQYVTERCFVDPSSEGMQDAVKKSESGQE